MTRERITLSGERADRFREIQQELTERKGYEPSKPEVIGRLLEQW